MSPAMRSSSVISSSSRSSSARAGPSAAAASSMSTSQRLSSQETCGGGRPQGVKSLSSHKANLSPPLSNAKAVLKRASRGLAPGVTLERFTLGKYCFPSTECCHNVCAGQARSVATAVLCWPQSKQVNVSLSVSEHSYIRCLQAKDSLQEFVT